jgi:hypothetical protein
MNTDTQITSTNPDGFHLADAAFAGGQQDSGPIVCNGWIPVAIVSPADLAGVGAVEILADASDGNYRVTQDKAGNPDPITLAADAFVKLQPPDYPGFVNIKLRADAAPATDLILRVLLRKIAD